ncbi:hypothetical protein H4R18_000803 [Coemansia javaensis]|uniref:Alpha/beta hydrolase fold-3 domain-containing protein n=1 Tax=Coemansia javaensis TaxID=2761396 RepID=A0A9W8HHA7_9FUNG|nr:hypothetical protein H4R18_000803 [Coemansia javaensis]
MLDHILGRPSASVRRVQACVAAAAAVLAVRQKRAPWGLRWLARWDRRVSLWRALIAWVAAMYVVRHLDDLLGLHAPEPLREYYSRSFYRAAWAFTALDAGFWTAMSIRPRWLRHVLSLVFSAYYLACPNRAADKVRKVRALITIDHLRVSWNKGADNPLLRLVRRLHSARLGVHRTVRVAVARGSPGSADLEPADCHVMFAGSPDDFGRCRSVVLNFPGGGFVAMGPESHSDYLSAWAARTHAVVVSVDYAKAPEYPYPYAIDQCYAVYREIVQSGGRCIGLEPDAARPLRIVLAGDSAGGNITAGVMFRILESADALPPPDGIVFIYGCFNVDIRAWMTRDETRTLLGASAHVPPDSARLHQSLSLLAGARNHLHHASPLDVSSRKARAPGGRKPTPCLDDRVRVMRRLAPLAAAGDAGDEGDIDSGETSPGSAASDGHVGYVPLAMTSSFTYFNDQILSPEMMRAMIIMYIGPAGRPNFRTDYYLSPLVAPDHLLARFPPVYFMCGEKDPMVDDTVLFAARIRRAKQRAAERGESSGARIRRGSRLFSRRHSQPRPAGSATRFYIGSTDVSEDEGLGEGSARPGQLPPSLRMSQFPPPGADGPAGAGDDAPGNSSAVIKVKLVAGMSHGFMQMYSVLPESKRVANLLGDWLHELLHSTHSFTLYSRCASAVDAACPADSSATASAAECQRGSGYASQTEDEAELPADISDWVVSASVAAQLKFGGGTSGRRRVRSPIHSAQLPDQPELLSPAQPKRFSPTRSIFDGGLVDKHGIEVVSAADMVRRRGHGLADPLN